MSHETFTAFYPSRPFWAGSKLDFQVPKDDGWFYDQMIEEVYSSETSAYAFKVCRDGRVLIRISSLERGEETAPDAEIERVGRPRSMNHEQVQHAKQLIAGGEPKRKVARLFKVSPATLYRAI